jgi:hypothetical protein
MLPAKTPHMAAKPSLTIVTFLRPLRVAYSNANSAMRLQLARVLIPEPIATALRVIVNWDVVLKADVEAFGILSHQHKINGLVASSPNQGSGGPHVGVEMELLAGGVPPWVTKAALSISAEQRGTLNFSMKRFRR